MPKRRFINYSLVVLFFGIITGCISNSMTKISPPSSVASSKISSVNAPRIAQPIENITGEWRGIVNCNGKNMTFNMTIQNPVESDITANFYAQMGNSRIRSGETKLVGIYNLDSSYFKLIQSKEKNFSFRMNLEGVLDPESGRMSALARIGNYYGRDCGYAIADRIDKKNIPRSPPANSIDTIISYVEENSYKEENLRGMNDRSLCEDYIDKWLSQITSYDFGSKASYLYPEFGAYDLLSDEKFKPYFGRSFSELSSELLDKLSFQVSNGCAAKYFTNNVRGLTTRKVIGALNGVIGNSRGLHRGNFIIYPFARSVLENWRAHAVSLINLSEDYDSVVKQVPWRSLTLLWPSSGLDFNKEFRLRASLKIVEKLKISLDSIDNDFLSLHKLSLFLNPYIRSGITLKERKIANLMIGERLNQQLISSADVFLKGLSEIDDITTHLNYSVESGRYRYFKNFVNDQVVSKLNLLFSERREELIQGFIVNEEFRLNEILSGNTNSLSKLQSMVIHNADIRIKYKSISSHPSLVEFFRKHTKKRLRLIDANIDEISRKIIASKSKKELSEVYSRYVVIYGSKNLPSSIVKLDSIYIDRLKDFEPFYGLPGFEYLDAIYRGDYKNMRQLDMLYQRIAIESTNSKITEVFGIPMERNALNIAAAVVQSHSLIDPVVATYLFNYSESSRRCLRSGYREFSVSTTEVKTTRNGLGDYISTNYGPVSVTNYAVNKEFLNIFKKIYNLSTNSLVFKGVDPINGTRKILDQHRFSCDSPQIKTFERNLIKLFNKHHGY